MALGAVLEEILELNLSNLKNVYQLKQLAIPDDMRPFHPWHCRVSIVETSFL